jgi:cytochrome P450
MQMLPRTIPPAKPLGIFSAIRAGLRNPIEAWPQSVYDEPVVHLPGLGGGQTFISSPELVQQVMVTSAGAFRKSKEFRAVLSPLVGESIVVSDGEAWKMKRRITAPMFRADGTVSLLPEMFHAVHATVERWTSAGKELQAKLLDEMLLVSLSLTARTMLSDQSEINGKAMIQHFNDYLDGIQVPVLYALLNIPDWVPMPGRRRRSRTVEAIRGEFRKIIAERKANGPSSQQERSQDLLDQLLSAVDPETNRPLPEQSVIDNIVTYIAAGFESTATGLVWALYLLAVHPAIEARALQEIEDVTRGTPLSPEHIGKLQFIRQVICEAMRLYPPSPAITRETVEPINVGDIHLEQGASVMISPYVVHRHKLLCEEPDAFDPDRFSPDQVRTRHRYAFLPFGAGHRICIGMNIALSEMIVVVATLLRSFSFHPISDEVPKVQMLINLNPSNGLPVTIRRRT